MAQVGKPMLVAKTKENGAPFLDYVYAQALAVAYPRWAMKSK